MEYTETVTYEAPLASGFAGFIYGDEGSLEDATVTVDGQTATTNEQGFYQITNVTPGAHTVTISAEGYETVSLQDKEVLENELSTLSEDISTKLIKTGDLEITGVIVDSETGANIDDSTEVLLEAYDEENDSWDTVAEVNPSNGTYTVDQTIAGNELELGTEYRQTVKLDGYKDFTQTVTLDNEDVLNELDGIQLEPIEELDLTGTVTDSEGNIVENATVVVYDEEGTQVGTATTDGDGNYSLEELQLLSGNYNVVVDDADGTYAISYTEVDVTEGTDSTHDVELESGNEVSATIGTESLTEKFGPADVEADDATYTLSILNGNTEIDSVDDTIVAGSPESVLEYDFTRIAPGDYTVKLTGPLVETEEFELTVDGEENLEERANPAGVLTGSVDTAAITDFDGKVEVSLLDDDANVVDTTEVETDGSYTFNGVPAGDYSVEATANGFVDAALDEEVSVNKNEVTDQGTDIVLDAVETEGTATGVVREEGSLAPVSNATVTYYNADGEEEDSFTVDPGTGVYNTSSLEEGNYKVVIRGEGVESYSTTQEIEAGEDLTSVNYTLDQGGDASLEITAVDSDGNSVNIAEDGIDISDGFEVEGGTAGTWTPDTEAGETVTLEDLSGGSYSLDVDFVDTNYVDAENVTATLATSEEGELELVVEEVADQRDVDFRVVDENNEDLDGATVVVYNEDGTIKDVETTDADGTVADYKLVDGNYKLAVYQNGYVVAERDVTVDGDNVTIPVIQLSPIK